jgi:arylsulfatase A-like enzyme
MATRPNIVFLISDDHRFDALGVAGDRTVRTPHMDALAARGTHFTHACNMGAMHGAVCMPSRAMIMTSRTLFHLKELGRHIPAEDVTFPELLQQHGYHTHAVGKWHSDQASHLRCFQTGSSLFFGGMFQNQWKPAVCERNATRTGHTEPVTVEKHATELFADSAVEFLNGYKDQNPFMLYVAFTSPHDPRTPPQEFLDLYPPEKVPLPPNFLPEHPFDHGEMGGRDENLAPHPRPKEVVQRHIAEYYGMVTHLDAQIGRILKTLEQTGRAENTIVVYTADHGLAVGQHGLFGKQNLYDHSIRVPMIMSGPGVPRGRKVDSFCYLLDLYPTICGLLKLDAPKTVEGKSLVPLMAGRAQELRETMFFAFKSQLRSVRDRRLKLLEWSVKGVHTTQLFDTANDPYETRNLAEESSSQKDLTRLREELRRWQTEVDDPG